MSIFQRAGVRLVSEDAINNLGAGMHPRISIKGGRFALIDAGNTRYPWPHLTLPVVILGANPNKSKVYYSGAYDPSGETDVPPTCFSDNGVAPSMNANQKMARTCAECELGAWGSKYSDFSGKQTKACNDRKKLAVIVVGDTTELVYELQVPPATLKNLNKYANFVGTNTTPDGSRKADLSDIVTELAFDTDSPFVLTFNSIAWLDQIGPDGQLYNETAVDGGAAIAARIDAICASDVIDNLVGLKDIPWSGPAQLPGPASVQQLEAPQPLPIGAPRQEAVAGPFAGPPGAQPSAPARAFPGAAAQPQRPLQQLLPPQQQAPAPATTRGGPRKGAGRPPGGGKQAAAPVQGLPQRQPVPQAAPAAQPAGQPRSFPLATPQQTAASDPGPVPKFLQRAQPVPQQEPVAAQQETQGHATHGMTDAPPPPSNIADAVNAAMALRTQR